MEEEVLRRIRNLENKVNLLMQREDNLINTNRSIIQDLNNVKNVTTTILNILNSKHRNNNEKIITSINLYKKTQEQHTNLVTFILELLDGRIAVGCAGGAISLNQMNYETKEWKVFAQKNKTHDDHITSLCEISNKRVISSSDDGTIEVFI